MPGALHEHLDEWEELDPTDEVRDWIRNRVNVKKLLKHFKGNYKGRTYDSDTPPKMYFPNGTSCFVFKDFVIKTLIDRVANGSLEVIGKVGECQSPI